MRSWRAPLLVLAIPDKRVLDPEPTTMRDVSVTVRHTFGGKLVSLVRVLEETRPGPEQFRVVLQLVERQFVQATLCTGRSLVADHPAA